MAGEKEEELLDVEGAIEALNEALGLQYRSALQYSLVSAGLTGIAGQSIANVLVTFGDAELADTRALIEKIVALDGAPSTDVAPLRHSSEVADSLSWLIETETEAIEALQQAIEPTGREGRSEALEHMLEHMIMRKQRQVDMLIRARRT
ncbi:MAG: ferritin-like domain-containing protein [Solirubrobacterales bacterium]